MQEIKHLILRVGTVANVEEYVFDGPMADAHIQGYLNQGFTLHTSHPGSVDQSTNSMSVFYVLIRETEQALDWTREEAGQDQVNQMVRVPEPKTSQKIDVDKWQTSEDPALVHARTDSNRFA